MNGIYYPNYSELLELPDNNYIGPLDKALELEKVNIKDHLGSLVAKHSASITELNTANIKDGFVIKLSKLREPINVEILNINEGSDGQVFFHPRNLIILDNKQSRFTTRKSVLQLASVYDLATVALLEMLKPKLD